MPKVSKFIYSYKENHDLIINTLSMVGSKVSQLQSLLDFLEGFINNMKAFIVHI